MVAIEVIAFDFRSLCGFLGLSLEEEREEREEGEGEEAKLTFITRDRLDRAEILSRLSVDDSQRSGSGLFVVCRNWTITRIKFRMRRPLAWLSSEPKSVGVSGLYNEHLEASARLSKF